MFKRQETMRVEAADCHRSPFYPLSLPLHSLNQAETQAAIDTVLTILKSLSTLQLLCFSPRRARSGNGVVAAPVPPAEEILPPCHAPTAPLTARAVWPRRLCASQPHQIQSRPLHHRLRNLPETLLVILRRRPPPLAPPSRAPIDSSARAMCWIISLLPGPSLRKIQP